MVADMSIGDGKIEKFVWLDMKTDGQVDWADGWARHQLSWRI